MFGASPLIQEGWCLLVGLPGTLPPGPGPGSTWLLLAAPRSPGGSQARGQPHLEGS